MSLKEQLKKETKTELEKLKKMSWKDKIWYIWEYYKLHMIAAAMLIFAIYIVGTILYQSTFTTQLYTIIVNNKNADGASTAQLDQGFKEFMGYTSKDRVETDPTLYMTYDGAPSEFAYASMAKVSAMVASKELDVMIADSASIDHYCGMNGISDLSQVLPEELFEQLKDQLYYVENENGQTIPCAVSLENTRFEELTGVVLEPAYFSIFSNSTRTDAAVSYLEYIVNQ